MTAFRSFFASIGIALAGVGLLFVLAPEAASTLPLPRVGVVVLGLFALVQGVRSLQTRRRSGIDGAETPDVESRLETDRPGDEFDQRVALLARSRGLNWSGGERERLRRRLRAAAVEAVGHRWRLSTEAASDRIEAGEWTDDPAAAWFLGRAGVPRPPWRVRVQAFVEASTTFGYYANRTADAVVELREGT